MVLIVSWCEFGGGRNFYLKFVSFVCLYRVSWIVFCGFVVGLGILGVFFVFFWWVFFFIGILCYFFSEELVFFRKCKGYIWFVVVWDLNVCMNE